MAEPFTSTAYTRAGIGHNVADAERKTACLPSVGSPRLPRMTLSTFDCIAAITEHSAGFAEATRDNLDARVEHCPDWSVADLVWSFVSRPENLVFMEIHTNLMRDPSTSTG